MSEFNTRWRADLCWERWKAMVLGLIVVLAVALALSWIWSRFGS